MMATTMGNEAEKALVHRELVDALFDTTTVKEVVEVLRKSGCTTEEAVQKMEQLFGQIAVACDAQKEGADCDDVNTVGGPYEKAAAVWRRPVRRHDRGGVEVKEEKSGCVDRTGRAGLCELAQQ